MQRACRRKASSPGVGCTLELLELVRTQQLCCAGAAAQTESTDAPKTQKPITIRAILPSQEGPVGKVSRTQSRSLRQLVVQLLRCAVCNPKRTARPSEREIRPEHLERAAYVYIRAIDDLPSPFSSRRTETAVRIKPTSASLGFRAVVVIDEDLGRSGSGLQEPPRFGRLLRWFAREPRAPWSRWRPAVWHVIIVTGTTWWTCAR